MSPLDYIKEGIQEGNWATVCEGYRILTGETLPPPLMHDTEKAMKRIADIVSDILPEKFDKITKENRDRPKKKRKNTAKKKITKKFDGEDDSLDLDDGKKTIVQKSEGGTRLITNNPSANEIDDNVKKAERARAKKAKLKRSSPKKYSAKCNECDETFESDRPDGEMGQKCDKCLRQKKSRFV